MFSKHGLGGLTSTWHLNCLLRVVNGRAIHYLTSTQWNNLPSSHSPSFSFTLSPSRLNLINNNINQSPSVFQQSSVRRASSFSGKLVAISESIGTSWPVQKCTDMLIWIHDVTGLPWWISVIGSTMVFRSLIVFPFMCYDRRIIHKLINVGPEINDHTSKVAEQLKRMVEAGQLKREKFRINLLRAYKKKANQVYIDNNVHPGQRIVLIAFQFPFWITMSSSLNNLCVRPYLLNDPLIHNQFFNGGVAWFENLTIPDPYYVWPVLFFVSIISSIKFTELIKKQNRPINVPETKFEKYLMIILKGWTVMLLGLSTLTPSGCVLYWATSAACGTLHHYLLSFPKLRRTFRIPPIKNEPKPLDWKRLISSTQRVN